MYLGYKHLEDLTVFSQRLYFLYGKVKFTFFDTVSLDENYSVQGMSVNAYKLNLETAEQLCSDLNTIHVNRIQFDGEDKLFIIGDPIAVQMWYNVKREGSIANKVIKHFGGTEGILRATEGHIKNVHEALEESEPKYSAIKK